jgi:hypothetical protein
MLPTASTGPGAGVRTAAPDLAAPASGALAKVIEAGARRFIAEPWRIARLMRGANEMSAPELCAGLARRRRAGPPADLNLAIAWAQLSAALKAPAFEAAWRAWRSSLGEG